MFHNFDSNSNYQWSKSQDVFLEDIVDCRRMISIGSSIASGGKVLSSMRRRRA